MVVLRDCNESGMVISPTDSEGRDKLQRDCLRHATSPNWVIDWDVFQIALLCHKFSDDLSSDSSSSDGSDSDCVFLYSTLGPIQDKEVCDKELEFIGKMDLFSDEVRNTTSLYNEIGNINIFRSERDISSTSHEEDV